MSLSHSIWLFISLVLTSLSTIVIYRLYFHPLAKFPGPFLASLSGLPAYYQTRKKDRHVWLWRLQERYGPVIRITPNTVLFNTPSGVKSIYSSKANVQKAEYYKVYPHEVESVTTWNSINKTVHARKRRVLSRAFSEKALRSAEPFIHRNVDRWSNLIAQKIEDGGWTEFLDMADWATYLIFDILGDLCFSKSFDMKEAGSDLRGVPGLMISFLEIMHPVGFSPYAGVWAWLKPRGLNRVLDATTPEPVQKWNDFVRECFQERLRAEIKTQDTPGSETSVQKDFFHYLLRKGEHETNSAAYSDEELLGESETMIIAGSDTTAIALSAAMFYLIHNPTVQATLVEEICSTFTSYDDITAEGKLYTCKYLRAFITEVLRMSPPVPADLPREVLQDGIVVDGDFIPAGTRVGTAAYCLHYNEAYFEEPFSFRPERWMVSNRHAIIASYSEEDAVSLSESAFGAFSTGPRGCVGKNLAYLELCIILAKIIYRFEIKGDLVNNVGGGSLALTEGRQVSTQYQLHDIFVAVQKGPMVRFKERLHA